MSKTNGRKITAAQNRERAAELKKMGFTYADIGKELGVSRQRAHQYVKEELEKLAEMTQGSIIALRQRSIERIDRMVLSLWSKAIKGDFQAIDRVVKLMEQEAKLLGLHAPQKIAPTTPDGESEYQPRAGMTPEERDARIAELLAAEQNDIDNN